MARGLPTSPLVVHRAPRDPVHVQIATWLSAGIARGELRPGDRLPGERDLAERLGVSRMTLRQALAELESTGDLVRVAGRAGGAFVAEPRVEVDLTHLSGLTDQLRRAGRRAGAQVLLRAYAARTAGRRRPRPRAVPWRAVRSRSCGCGPRRPAGRAGALVVPGPARAGPARPVAVRLAVRAAGPRLLPRRRTAPWSGSPRYPPGGRTPNSSRSTSTSP